MTEWEYEEETTSGDLLEVVEILRQIESDLDEIHGTLDSITGDRVDLGIYTTSQIVSSALLGLIAGILLVLVFKRK